MSNAPAEYTLPQTTKDVELANSGESQKLVTNPSVETLASDVETTPKSHRMRTLASFRM